LLLLAPDGQTLDDWRRALLGLEIRVVEAATGIASTARQRIDIAVGRWNRKSVDAIRALHPAVRLVHCEAGLPGALIEAIGHGADIQYVRGSDDLRAVVLRLTRPRRAAARLAIDGLTVEIADRGRHRLLDLSSAGLAFVLAEDADVAMFLPGESLSSLSVSRGDRVLLDGAEARVTRLEPVGASYHVGCALRAPASNQSVLRVIRDPATCAGLVQGAVRSRHLILRRAAGDGQELQCTRAHLDLAAHELELGGLDHTFAAFDVVEGLFELAGVVYRFRTACASAAPLRLRLPAAVEVMHQRTAPRSAASAGLRISLESPFAGAPIERRVRDISTTGVSFDIGAATDPLPVGTRIATMTLHSGKSSIRLTGRVRHLVDRAQHLRCGLEFEGVDARTRQRLVELIMADRYPTVDCSDGVDFDGLLAFMREARYLDETREEALRPLFPEARRIHTALRRDGNSLQRTLVVRDEKRMVGHIAGLQAYPRTWMFHHLAALPGHRAAGVVSVAAMDQLLHESQSEFFRAWFLASARFPSRVFGGFARKLPNGPLSDVRAYAHAMLPTATWASQSTSLEVGDATRGELLLVEQRLVASLPPIVVQAEDLTRQGLHLDALDRRYQRIGLHRGRRVLVARRDGRMLGFALAEVSSPGLNLADALSSFRVTLLGETPVPAAQEARRALVGAAASIYARTGRQLARCLIAPEETADYAALGMQLDEDTSLCWTCHRSQFQAFTEHMKVFFEEIVARDRSGERADVAA